MTELVAGIQIDALVESAHEGVDTDDGKDQPKDQAHQQHIKDGGEGTHQSIDHHLKVSK